MIRKQFKTLFWSILLFPLSALAANTNTTQYIPFHSIVFPHTPSFKMLIDRAGKIIFDENSGVQDLFYQDNYWIAKLNLDISIGNIAQADDFKYAFEKQGNILIFKVKDNLIYLGSERIAYYYKDTELSVLIDTDGNLITPKNTYYKNIGPFVNGFAKTVNQNNKNGYLDLNGQFLLTLPISARPKALNLSKYGKNCRSLSFDNIMFLCDLDSNRKIVNINTKKKLILSSEVREGYYPDDKTLYMSTDKFWIKYGSGNYMRHQLYDYDLNLIYEGEFDSVSPFYGNVAWVRSNYSQDYHLIDSKGKILSDNYYSFKVVKSGDDVVFYANKSGAYNKINGEHERSVIQTILDSNGKILLYDDEVGNKELTICNTMIPVLKNAEHEIVWPVDIEKVCLVKRYINTPTKIKSYEPGYRRQDEQDKDNYPLVANDKVAEITDYLLKKEAINLKNSFLSSGKYFTGPKKIIIDNFAELDLPEGYVYHEVLGEKDYPCARYVAPAYSKSGKMCISIHNFGYVNLTKQKNNFDKNINLIKRKVEDSLPYHNSLGHFRYAVFDWLVEPELNISENSLKFGYYYHKEKINEKLLQTNIVGFKQAYLKFGKDNVVIVNSNNDAIIKDQINDVDWAKQIKILEPYQYNPDSSYSCARLSLHDSTLSSGYYDYFGQARCFPGPVTRFIYEEFSVQHLHNTTLKNALELTEYQHPNEHSYLFQRKFR